MHANGFDSIRAINVLNFLIGNHDWKGGHISAAAKFSPLEGRYALEEVPNPNKAWGIPITREKSAYQKSSLFKKGEPAKRRWYPFGGNLIHDVLPSAAARYPYGLKALFIHRHSPVNSSPGGQRLAMILQDQKAVELVVPASAGGGTDALARAFAEIVKKHLPQPLIVNDKSLAMVEGIVIDFQRQGLNASFVFHNPNATGECGCGESFTIS